MYDATAASYASMMDKEIQLPMYSEVLERLKSYIVNKPGTLIDTACGSGHMLSMYHQRFEPQRELLGIDLSPCMVTITQKRLGSAVSAMVADMRYLSDIESGSAAAMINYYAIHHLDSSGVRVALEEWHRVLAPEGVLFLAAWEGAGLIDYGDAADIEAVRYTCDELSALAQAVGFKIFRCEVEPVEDFPMDALYLECRKIG